PILANIDEIRKYEAYFQYMKEKNLIPDEKIRLIAYDYKKGINLQENLLQSFLGGNKYIGSVEYQSERERFRNLNSYFAKVAFEKHLDEYIKILSHFNIIQGKNAGSKIGVLLGSLFRNK
ncbi:MAG: hypothetical protein Q8942_14285, partial [Bacillota bacterium]|nr:hypothetical protein [Bacillota bacterium]